ncbi:MAG: hypothetical protein H0U95_06315 [Bacteroidetes bacterium]|nr:hypothetical protein [Bacteroidota bacterium]
MIFYLTVNEAPSGIFSSQVIDVVKFLNTNFDTKARLLAFISLRGYFVNRAKIKQELPNAIVLPMYPKMQNWEKNKFLFGIICWAYKTKMIIARSVIASKLALVIRDKNKAIKVIYDGRGAIEAEWREYKVVTDTSLLTVISAYEREVILNSDFRIAVSSALVNFWKSDYSYKDTKHVVIPCTLNAAFEKINITGNAILEKRKELKVDVNDTVFVYSGSVAGWQSFNLLVSFIEPILKKSNSNKMVFFSPADPNLDQLKKLFPGQVICKHLKPEHVTNYLIVGDYGLLIRENSITNKVASPVKYAEYLASGLKVILSDGLGDYSQLSVEKNWGFIFKGSNDIIIKPTLSEKQKISSEAIQFFSKQNYKEQYKQLISA